MAKKPRLTLTEVENSFSTNRFSSFRTFNNRARSSIISPHSIDLNNEDNVHVQVHEDDQNDALQCYITKTTWNICRASPLFNFNYSPTKLKQYALKIKQYLTANVSNSSTSEFKVEVKVVEHLKLQVDHSDAIQIRVFDMSNSNENIKQLYDCILFSWGSYVVKENNLTYLPILLDHGQAKIATHVRLYLKKLFDCIIAPLSFTQDEMLFFVALLSSFSPNDGNKEVKLIYNVPIVTKTSINITMMTKYIHKMWLSCFPENSPPNMINDKIAWRMYSSIQKFIKHAYEVDIGRLELDEIRYPSITLQNHGKIQLNDLDISRSTLRLLCQMSVILKGSMPKLEAEYD